jgi:7-carboxy-7-deazaguanine synthase
MQTFFELTEPVFIVCSPKTPKVHQSIEHEACAYKYVLTEGKIDPDDGLPTEVLGLRMRDRPARPPRRLIDDCEVYVQPADEQDEKRNRANMEATVESCRRFGYRLCLQTHKIAGLP